MKWNFTTHCLCKLEPLKCSQIFLPWCKVLHSLYVGSQVYLDYLQQWVQMIEQQRVQKNILKEEWFFVSGITKHIPGGQALVGSSFW